MQAAAPTASSSASTAASPRPRSRPRRSATTSSPAVGGTTAACCARSCCAASADWDISARSRHALSFKSNRGPVKVTVLGPRSLHRNSRKRARVRLTAQVRQRSASTSVQQRFRRGAQRRARSAPQSSASRSSGRRSRRTSTASRVAAPGVTHSHRAGIRRISVSKNGIALDQRQEDPSARRQLPRGRRRWSAPPGARRSATRQPTH